MIEGVALGDFDKVRDSVRGYLEGVAARDLDGATVDDIERDIITGRSQLWLINEGQAICLTCITKEAVRVEAAVGSKRREWQEELDDHLKNWAKALGKKRVVGLVRPGWYKWAKTQGYRLVHSQIAIEV